MINFPVSPGTSPYRIGIPTTTDWNLRQKWGDSTQVPQTRFAFTDPSNVQDPANSSHTNYINDIDPRSDLGKANPRNPNSKNYNNYNPTMDRESLSDSFLQQPAVF